MLHNFHDLAIVTRGAILITPSVLKVDKTESNIRKKGAEQKKMRNDFNETIATRTHRKRNEFRDDERHCESKRSSVTSYQQSMHRNFRANFRICRRIAEVVT